MAEGRSLIIDKLVNPAVMGGTKVYAGKVTNVDNTKTVTMVSQAVFDAQTLSIFYNV